MTIEFEQQLELGAITNPEDEPAIIQGCFDLKPPIDDEPLDSSALKPQAPAAILAGQRRTQRPAKNPKTLRNERLERAMSG